MTARIPSFFGGGGGGGGGSAVVGSVPYWSDLKARTSPHVADDDFSDASIDASWHTFDPGGVGTFTETLAERLKISVASGGDAVAGKIKNVDPAVDEYNVTLGFRPRGNATNFLHVGLIAGGSDMLSAPSTANLLVAVCVLRNQDWFWELDKYSDGTHYANTDGTLDDGPFSLVRWHVKKSANRIGMLVGGDRRWVQVNDSILDAAGLTGTNPVYFGPMVNNIGSGEVGAGVFDLFQVEETTDRFAPVGGWVNLATV